MNEAALTLAFAAGTLAAVNPCGFALLPAYLTLFVSGGDTQRPAAAGVHRGQGVRTTRALAPLRRAGMATAAMTAGFVVVFGTFALIITPFALSVERALPWATVVIGFGLLGLGGWLLAGRELTVATPKLGTRSDPTASARAMGAYGISFAVASLSCTVGPFLAVTTTAFRDNSVLGVVGVFVAYALGMGSVVGALTLAVALSREALVRRLRSALPYVTRVGGGLLILAGAYAAYYGWYEIRVLRGDRVNDPIIDTAIAWQADLSRAIAGLDARDILGAVVVLAALAWLAGRAGTRRRARVGVGSGGPGASPCE
ncbi:cytochrome c biogenesis protein CcdA [Sporichthya sp.]|uniref:cytochrome c biogenesis CcdA family protein n=1 Tax=Sporichthya sp. TaxID=65475 RepID=UPI0017D97873|nr:cytochrome c biogenesis protein CcdA [Sporichthya sp.]MBA3744490.1 cytochrome c biogenesis protein CcdA [Sporichthya sp.]